MINFFLRKQKLKYFKLKRMRGKRSLAHDRTVKAKMGKKMRKNKQQ